MNACEKNLPPRFLHWKLMDGRKVPVDAKGRKCDAHDVANHLSYDAAMNLGGNLAFAMRAGDGLFFLDLDKCWEDGAWTAEASAIFQAFPGALGEVSQSGTGLHIIGRCDPSKLADRRNKWDGWLEFYTDARFIAFGGKGWQPIGGGALDLTRDWTETLLKLVPQREILGDLPEGIDETYTGPADDDQLIQIMLASKGGASGAFGMKATVVDLWNADAEKLGRFYPAYDGKDAFDRSSADMALMSHLAFWTGKDMPRMDRLFRRSGLMREKYEQREDYRRETVGSAARLCNAVYDKKTAPGQPADAPVIDDGSWQLTMSDMKEMFEGCVYIRDIDRIMVPDGAMLKATQFKAHFGGKMFQMMPDFTKPSDDAWNAFTNNKCHSFPKALSSAFYPGVPTGTIVDGNCNVWVDPKVVMEPGDVSRYIYVLEKLLPNENDRAILLSYMASLVQNPGVKFQWAPVLQGAEGNGKTLIFSALKYAVGKQYTHDPSARQLGSNFNAWNENKILILVEEVHMRGRFEILDDLKPKITNVEIEVEGKGVDKRMIRNIANWLFCTNYKDAVIKHRGDRRYAVFFTAHQEPEDIFRDFGEGAEYLRETYRWLQGGGYAAVAHFLKHYPIDPRYDPAGSCQRAPETSSFEEVIAESRGPVADTLYESTQDGTPGMSGGWISTIVANRVVKDSGFKVGGKTLAKIIEDLGYEKWGRAPRSIPMEGNKQPIIYILKGRQSDFEDYVRAQKYSI